MSIYIDRKFLHIVSPKLDRFSEKKQDLYNFRCPFCGDSQKNKTKCRGFIFAKKNDYFYMCHNCGVSTTFYNFLSQLDSTLVKEYALERYKNGETGKNNYTKPSFEAAKTKPIFKKKIGLESIDELPEAHFAKNYVQQRRIPQAFWSQLYYAADFKKFVDDLGIEKEGLKENDQRLVIPFYDENKNLIGFQGRALGESKLRYITIKVNDDGDKLYGLDRVDWNKTVYVVEGPIDSMFLKNSIATADANLAKVDRDNVVLVFDNEPRNKDIVRHINKAIEEDFAICLWPESTKEKDINDMVKSGISPDEIQSIIDSNTFSGLRARMEFINWKKI